MSPIRSVEDLVDILNSRPLSEYAKIFKRIRFEKDDLASFSTWEKGDYTRNCLVRTPSYELILLCWDTDAETPIHGHGGKNCWVYQVQGTVEEIRFKEVEGDNLEEDQRILLNPGKLTYMNDRMGYHVLRNHSDQRAMTLHIYAEPIDRCKVYNESKDRFEVQEMSYDTYEENLAELKLS